jgi:hypothetical protein
MRMRGAYHFPELGRVVLTGASATPQKARLSEA